MKFEKKQFILSFLIILSVVFTTFVWDKIFLPYKDPLIVGEYSENKYNSTNDILRYLLFIFLPISVFFSYKVFIEKKFNQFLTEVKYKTNTFYKTDQSIYSLSIIVILLIILEFLSLDFQVHKLDLLHEGQQLSSAYKSLMDGSLWSGSYVTTGIFHETISTKILWSLFDFESIGLKRYTDILLILILKVLLIILLFKVTKFLKIDSFYKNVFFIFNSLIFLKVIDYNIASVDHLLFRSIPVIFLLILITEFLQNEKLKNYIIILLGSISICSLLWGIDRGLVCNLIIFSFALYLLIKNNYKSFFFLIFSIFLWWILFFFLLGEEFSYFISNTLSVYKEMTYIGGIIHPVPFSDQTNSSRATKTIISILLILILSMNLFFKKTNKISLNFKFFFVFLSLIAFCSYAYVVGRSDGPHIKSVFGYPIIFFSIYFSYQFLIFFENKVKYKFSFLLNFLLIFITIILFNFFFHIKPTNILKYPSRVSKYIKLPDEDFLTKKQINFIKETFPLIKDQECIQLFVNDAALNYLLRKKSCSRYYLIMSVGSISNQKKFVEELKYTQLIISAKSNYIFKYPISEQLPVTSNYIENNYEKFRSIEDWEILKLK